MPRYGYGYGYAMAYVGGILAGGGSTLPNDYVAHYLARINNLATVPTNSVEKWFDTSAKSYGSEEVTNGDFEDGDNGWVLASGTSVISGLLDFNNVNGGWSYSDSSSTTIGVKYLLKVNVTSFTQGSVLFYDSVSGASIGTVDSEGSHEISYTATSNTQTIAFIGTSSATLSISNISVKQVLTGHNDLTQTTSSQQPTYVEGYKGVGDELVIDSNKTVETGWIDNGDGSYTVSSATGLSRSVRYFIGSTNGITQVMTFTIDSISSGSINAFCGNGAYRYPSDIDTVGEYRVYTTSSSDDTNARFQASPDFVGTISNLSVKLAERDTSLDTVSFDGLDDNMEGLPPQSGDFSYVFKGILLNASTSNQNILRPPSGLKSSFQTNVAVDSFLLIGENSAQYNFTSYTIDYGTDLDVVITKTETELSLYINGLFVESLSHSTSFIFEYLGRTQSTINGTLPELGVYNRALTLEEIEEISGIEELNNIESTSQACYQLSSIKASSTSDILVSSWRDVISGTYNLVQTNDDNKPLFTGDTVKFDGNNDFLSGLPLNEGDFTIVFKGLSFGEAGGTEVLLTKDDNATPTIRMFTNGLLTARTTDGTQINLINYSSFRSSVHNLGFIKRGNQLETWVDRVMLGSSTIPSGELLLNQIGRTSSSFNGEIKDSIFVFDRALSDVDALYIGGVTTLNGEDADGNSLADSQGNIIKIVEKE